MPYKQIGDNEKRIEKLEGIVKSLLHIMLNSYTDDIALDSRGSDHFHESFNAECLDKIEKLLKGME